MENLRRAVPNILVTGTPGVGKSTLCGKLAELTGLRWLEVSKIAIENNCLEEYDEVYQCPVLDEDKTDNTTLYDRLTNKGYSGKKLEDNVDCEIFQIVLEEAKSSYDPEIVHELISSTFGDLENNIQRICYWLNEWVSAS